jgi:hypothetical protein
MGKKDRAKRWERRKARKDGRTAKRGFLTGNPRYSGKGGDFTLDTRAHKSRKGAS